MIAMKYCVTKGFIRIAICLCVVTSSLLSAAKPPLLPDVDDERWMKLEQAVKTQRPAKRAGRKSAKLERRKTEVPTVPLVPLHKLSPVRDLSFPSLDFSDEDTVADSSQESMHPYYKGIEAMQAKQYDQAVKSFSQFVTMNPRHPYADRAQFFVAEAAFLSKEYGLALVATNLLESRYPHSLKLPEVLNRRTLSLVHLNQKNQARETFEKLRREFPNHPMVSETEHEMASISTLPRVDDSTDSEGQEDAQN